VGGGNLVRTVRARCRTDDVLAPLDAVLAVCPAVPKLLVWDNDPPAAADTGRGQAANITLAFLLFRSPELMSLENL
jgi:hypothetical protein